MRVRGSMGVVWAGVLGAAAFGWAAGCGDNVARCELNPYACGGGGGSAQASGGSSSSTGGGGTEPLPCGGACGPCELCGADEQCHPVRLPSQGACPTKQTCSVDHECKREDGQPCMEAADCASGFCPEGSSKKCAPCTSEVDCPSGTCDSGVCGK